MKNDTTAKSVIKIPPAITARVSVFSFPVY